MLTVVTFKWEPTNPGFRSKYNGEHVNVLARMVARHYPEPHRFVCISDSDLGLSGTEVEFHGLWNDYKEIGAPQGQRNPSCYRRLKMFDAQYVRKHFGDRTVQLDLDAVILDDLRPLWNRPDPICLLKGTNPTVHYNGSMLLKDWDANEEVWTDFDPVKSPQITRDLGVFGSDQAWLSFRLGPNKATWSQEDGVYSFRNDISNNGMRKPDNARIVFFQGQHDPWDPMPQKVEWIRENWK